MDSQTNPPLIDMMETARYFHRFTFVLIMLLPTATRAFSLGRTMRLGLTRMSMSSSSADTSIVDICQQKIQSALEADSVKVTGAYDDPNGSHISIQVVSDKFTGKRPVQRQQLVYKAIWEELQGPVHAVDSMVCQTKEEAAEAS